MFLEKYFYKLILSYDGTCYCGYQKQPQTKTIQQTLENALKSMTKRQINTFAASRTDKGVHAQEQTIHFQTAFAIELKRFKNTLNRILPPDIRIKKIEKATADFHARYWAKSKIYHYIFAKKPLNAFNYHFQVFVANLDFAKIKSAMNLIIGKYNFASFTNDKKEKNFNKTVLNAFVKETSQNYILIFHADGFLKYMVRFLVGGLIEIGKNKMSLELFKAMLTNTTNQKVSLLAPAKGLFLKKIFY
ncbi:tRNA pseudouridine synthase A [Candidatus Phytoplasma australiense]|uniref:tRNA pseudouridine synthase A n=1 Tax=Phytoplasma australiense TaxID=59748 RepID=B1V973_PHYAS|nr:tRNA pseudouridine synthase A [Candidatus Phytoplasma australiense]